MVTSQIARTKTKSWAVIVGVVVLAAGLIFAAFAIQKTPVPGTAAPSATAVAELEASRLAAEKAAADAESARLAAAQTALQEADRLAADAARVAAEQAAAEAASAEAEAARVAAEQAAAAEAARVEAEQAEREQAAPEENAGTGDAPETVVLDDGDGYLSELCGTDGCQDGETDGAPGFLEPTYSDPQADAQQLKESLGLDRDVTSGELQFMHGCQQGYIPADQCAGFTN